MGHRREDVGFLEYVRNLEAEVRRLRTSDKGVRQNDIRIGDQLIQEGPDDNSLKVTDLRDGSQFILPQTIPDVDTSDRFVFWPFNQRFTTLGFGANGSLSGPWIAPYDIEITKVVTTFDAQSSVLWSPSTVAFAARSGPAPYSSYNTSYVEINTDVLGPYPGAGEQVFAAENSRTAPNGWGYDPDRGPRYLNAGDAITWMYFLSTPSLTTTQLICSVAMYYRPRDSAPAEEL